jgi:tetratricopeptide (TPR) repeat protein
MADAVTRIVQLLALIAITAAAIVLIHYGVLLPLSCEANVTRAFDALDNVADRNDVAKRAAVNHAESLLRGCECLERTDVKLAYARGTIYRYRAEPARAIEAYRRALTLDRRPEIYIDLGLAQLDAMDEPGAVESFAAAGAFAPVLLERIPYRDVRAQTEQRIRAMYGNQWLR